MKLKLGRKSRKTANRSKYTYFRKQLSFRKFDWTSYHVIWRHVTWFDVTFSRHVLWCQTTFYDVTTRLMTSYHVLWRHTTFYDVIPRFMTSYLELKGLSPQIGLLGKVWSGSLTATRTMKTSTTRWTTVLSYQTQTMGTCRAWSALRRWSQSSQRSKLQLSSLHSLLGWAVFNITSYSS